MSKTQSPPNTAIELQERMIAFIRAYGFQQPEQTPCGQPISVSEAHAITELSRETGLTQQELSTRLRLEKSTTSRLVGLLEARGWLERQVNPHDARSICLVLTKAGLQSAQQVIQARREKFNQLLERIPKQERRAVLSALETLTEALHETEHQPA